MPAPIVAVLGRLMGGVGMGSLRGLMANFGRAGGGNHGPGRRNVRLDTGPFEDMVDSIKQNFGRGHPAKMEKIVKLMAGTVLGRTANDIGVAQPKGKFSKKISVGKKHLEKRYTWKRPATRGRTAGIPPGQYAHVAKSIKVGGRKFSLRSYVFYERQGSISLVTSALANIRREAVKRVGSGKAAFYKIAKDLRVPTNRFKDKSALIEALNACGSAYKRVSVGKEHEKSAEYQLEICSSASNALNPSVKGRKEFQKKINGIKNEYRTLVRKGYINTIDDIIDQYGAEVKG